MRRLLPITLVALAVAVPLALGQEPGARQTASVEFATKVPAKATFEDISIDYANPDDPEGKPPAVRKVETFLQGGARYHSSAVALCTASDAELITQGEAACPPESKIGEGLTVVDTGLDGPGRFVEAEIDFFNNTGELIYLTTVRGTGVHTVIRGEAYKRRTVTELEPLPGSPPHGGAIDTAEIRIGTIAGEPEGAPSGYLTTPPRCPKRGFWVNWIRFTYADGASEETRNRIRCLKR